MLMNGKCVLVMGVATGSSLAAAAAKKLMAEGAEVFITHHPAPAFEKHARIFAKKVGIDDEHRLVCDVSKQEDIDRCFDELTIRTSGVLDGFLHSIAYSDPRFLNMPFLEALDSPDFDQAFTETMAISVLSFIKTAHAAAKIMRNKNSGSIVTLTYNASQMVTDRYGLMTGAKAALESYARLLAYEFGEFNIRVNSVSASPAKTPSGMAVDKAYRLGHFEEAMSPLGRRATHEEIANEVLTLMSDLSTAITGQNRFVNCGRNIVGILPQRNEPLLKKAFREEKEGVNAKPAAFGSEAATPRDISGEFLTNDGAQESADGPTLVAVP